MTGLVEDALPSGAAAEGWRIGVRLADAEGSNARFRYAIVVGGDQESGLQAGLSCLLCPASQFPGRDILQTIYKLPHVIAVADTDLCAYACLGAL